MGTFLEYLSSGNGTALLVYRCDGDDTKKYSLCKNIPSVLLAFYLSKIKFQFSLCEGFCLFVCKRANKRVCVCVCVCVRGGGVSTGLVSTCTLKPHQPHRVTITNKQNDVISLYIFKTFLKSNLIAKLVSTKHVLIFMFNFFKMIQRRDMFSAVKLSLTLRH